MGTALYYLETAFVLFTMFTVLVAAHEYGHYLFARLFNMGVEEFAIGFGKQPVFQWMRRTYMLALRDGEVPQLHQSTESRFDLEASGTRPPEDIEVIDTPDGTMIREVTRFTVRPWPLGGFVRIKGMLPEEDGSEVTIAGGFYNKPPWQRLIVLFAGPMFSVLAGLLILIPLYMAGGHMIRDNAPIIGPIIAGGPADKGGLKEGDRVSSIDGMPIKTFADLNRIVRDSANKSLTLDVVRDKANLTLHVTPVMGDRADPVLDANLEPTGELRPQAKLKTGFRYKGEAVGFRTAVVMAVSRPIEAVSGILDMVRHPSTIQDSVGGPISITAVTYETVHEGIFSILELAALLSISVGVLNLLPIVPLDGGQMTMAIAEMFRRGKRLSTQTQGIVNVAGLAFMCVLIIGVFFVDIRRLADTKPAIKESKPPVKSTK